MTDPHASTPPSGSTRAHQAGAEGAQGLIVAAFQSFRKEIAGAILDMVPNAHTMTANKIAKMLPALAIMFKIKTPPGFLWDTMDDLVQELGQAIKEEAEARQKGGGHHGHPPPAPSASAASAAAAPVVDASVQYVRFIAAVASVYPPTGTTRRAYDDRLNWHDNLSTDDQTKLYTLVSQQTDQAHLEALVRQPVAVIFAALNKVKSDPKKGKNMTYLEFRAEFAKHVTLPAAVGNFVARNTAAHNLTPSGFWTAFETHAFGTLVHNVSPDMETFMSFSDDELLSRLHLRHRHAPNVSKIFTDLDNSSANKQLESAKISILDWINNMK